MRVATCRVGRRVPALILAGVQLAESIPSLVEHPPSDNLDDAKLRERRVPFCVSQTDFDPFKVAWRRYLSHRDRIHEGTPKKTPSL